MPETWFKKREAGLCRKSLVRLANEVRDATLDSIEEPVTPALALRSPQAFRVIFHQELSRIVEAM